MNTTVLTSNNLLNYDAKASVFDGIPLDDLYKIAIKFYKVKEKVGELCVEYPLRLQFMACSKQAKHGDYKNTSEDYGWFNFTGSDVNREWKKLTETNPGKEQAMLEFVRLLDVICPTFRDHINEQRNLEPSKLFNVDGEDTSRKSSGAITRLQNIANDCEIASKEAVEKFEQQKKLIQEALNKQTYHQFLSYAQQTHPGQPEKQEQLIKQLQEQHYEQYMSQVYARQAAAQAASIEAAITRGPPVDNSSTTTDLSSESRSHSSVYNQGLQPPINNISKVRSVDEQGGNDEEESEVSDEDQGEEVPSNPKIAPASMWTVKNIKDFKTSIQKEGPDGVLKIGHGETVTVRVPTHPDGNSLYWEFATDYYDIGFGVYFEWTLSESNAVTVHVEDSGDEEGEEVIELEKPDDVESGSPNNHIKHDPNKPQTDEIIPIFRRDSHQEVLAGSHVYPGTGVYLLKFDNSYSLWRSKTLYFRVYFSKS